MLKRGISGICKAAMDTTATAKMSAFSLFSPVTQRHAGRGPESQARILHTAWPLVKRRNRNICEELTRCSSQIRFSALFEESLVLCSSFASHGRRIDCYNIDNVSMEKSAQRQRWSLFLTREQSKLSCALIE